MKLIILVQNGTLAGQRRELENGSLIIGRGDDSDLKFDVNERLISKRHAVIKSEADGFYLIDTNSTNGTFVNGERVTRVKLNSNDVVRFGANGVQAAISIGQPVVESSNQNAFRVNVASQPTAPPAPLTPRVQPPPINKPPIPPTPPPIPRDYSSNESGGGKSRIGESFANLGLYNPEQKTPKSEISAAKYIGAAAVIISIVFLALIISVFTLFQIGLLAAIVSTIVAFVCAAVYILPLLWLDRYDPEPPLALALSFAWGALVAVFVSLIINTVIGSILGREAAAVISAPIFEEASKGIAVVLLLIFWRREFDGIVDGIVYAGVVALGFATVENVLYYGRGINAAGSQGLITLFILRGILSPFAHVIFTSMTGIGCGIARETHNKILRFVMPLVGYFGAVLLHAIWNGLATFGGGYFLVFYVIFEVPFFLIFLAFTIYMMRRENQILRQTLAIEVAKGAISPEQMSIVTSAFRSLGWMLEGLSVGKFQARRKFSRAVAKLGLAWWHIQRAQTAQGETRSFGLLPDLETEVKRWRAKV